ncbi:Spo0B domain-containing protein [Sporosarcina sp. ACRSL]|uniref:Spo0B domain-containing protein n=1 Tax=Sporosarcina sp. ACRSL TaxID=2918215 RepID=UPI001EF73A12|nr:Spo0B domain-containing protein [Sporosarcina sp. ACRSL]MCG7345023.1 Spo0B domain-containing protein [Sporosarcina sp. ACRSL]
MESENLTIEQALKFARHDFLNELQLMLLYMDLGKTSEARRTLLESTERMRHISMLEKLRLPKTELWLSTFEWRHTAFSKRLQCNIIAGNRIANDVAVADYLEKLIGIVEQSVDPLNEYIVHIAVDATENDWSIQLTIEGPLGHLGSMSLPQPDGDFEMSEILQDEQWTFTLRGR